MSETALGEALASGSPATLRDALAASRVAVIGTQLDGQVVPAVMTGPDGVPALLVFGSQETYGAWGRPEVVLMVPGSELGALAVRQPVDRVIFDPAGPAPYAFEPAALAAIIDGIEPGETGARVYGDLSLREAPASERMLAVREAVRPFLDHSTQAFLLERIVGSHGVTTLGVLGPPERIEAIVSILAGLPTGTVDVIGLDEATAASIAESIPQSRLNPL